MKVLKTKVRDLFKKIKTVERMVLYEATQDDDVDTLKLWFGNNTNKERIKDALIMTNTDGQTLLHIAALNGRVEVIDCLLPKYISNGIDVNKLYDKFHDNPFTLACTRGFSSTCTDSVKIIDGYERSERFLILMKLVDIGATINIQAVIKRKKNSPQHWTIYYGDYASSFLVYLMEPLQVFYQNDKKQTPFDLVFNFVIFKNRPALYDGLWIIDNLMYLVQRWLNEFTKKVEKENRNIKEIFSKNIIKKSEQVIDQGKDITKNIGLALGIIEYDMQDQHDDCDNPFLKEIYKPEFNPINIIKSMIENDNETNKTAWRYTNTSNDKLTKKSQRNKSKNDPKTEDFPTQDKENDSNETNYNKPIEQGGIMSETKDESMKESKKTKGSKDQLLPTPMIDPINIDCKPKQEDPIKSEKDEKDEQNESQQYLNKDNLNQKAGQLIPKAVGGLMQKILGKNDEKFNINDDNLLKDSEVDDKNTLDYKFVSGKAKLFSLMINIYKISSKGVKSSHSGEGFREIRNNINDRIEKRRRLSKLMGGGKKILVYDHENQDSIQTFDYVMHHLFFWLSFLERYEEITWCMEEYKLTPFFQCEYNDYTCLHMAAGMGKLDLIKFFLEKITYTWPKNKKYKIGKLVNIASKEKLFTPLHVATCYRKLDVVNYLIKFTKKEKENDAQNSSQLCYNSKSNKVFDEKTIKKMLAKKKSPYQFLFKNYSFRCILPLDMSQTSGIKDIKRKIYYQFNEFYLTLQPPDHYECIDHIKKNYMTEYQYCIVARADNADPYNTIIYKQLKNIAESWSCISNSTKQLSTSDMPTIDKNSNHELKFEFKHIEGFDNKDFATLHPTNNDNYFIWVMKINNTLRDYLTQFLDFQVFHNRKGYLKEYIWTKNASYEPIKDWMTQQIIIYLLKREFDLLKFLEEGVIQDHFPLHLYNRKEIIKTFWKKNWKKVFIYPLQSKQNSLAIRPISQIAFYYGQKTGFYFAFHATIISLLIPQSILTQAFFVVAFFEKEDSAHHKETPYVCILICLWATFFLEKWKKTQNEMSYIWDMNYISDDNRIPRQEFQGVDVIARRSNKVKKADFTNSFYKNIWTIPLMLIGIIMISCSFMIYLHFSQKIRVKKESGELNKIEAQIHIVILSSINGVIIFICSLIYKALTFLCVEQENHEYWNSYENSQIYKNFLFESVNSYFILFHYAYIDVDFEYVASNIISLAFSKQMLSIATNNFLPFVQYRLKKRQFLKKFRPWREAAKKEFVSKHGMQGKTWEELDKELVPNDKETYDQFTSLKKIKTKKDLLVAFEEKLVLTEQIEETRLMAEEADLNEDYEITAISVGYICFFSAAYPGVVLVLLILMAFKYFMDVTKFTTYQRRYVTSPTKNIGSWHYVFEIIIFLSTIANAAFVWLTCDGLAMQNTSTNKETEDNYRDIVVILVAEHIIFFLKIILSFTLSDVPKHIRKRNEYREYRRRTDKLKEKIRSMNKNAELKEFQRKQRLSAISCENYGSLDKIDKKKLYDAQFDDCGDFKKNSNTDANEIPLPSSTVFKSNSNIDILVKSHLKNKQMSKVNLDTWGTESKTNLEHNANENFDQKQSMKPIELNTDRVQSIKNSNNEIKNHEIITSKILHKKNRSRKKNDQD